MTTTRQDAPPPPRWARGCLRAAAIYNIAWGALVVLFPTLLFDLADLDPPRYPQIWQCVGMIVGVYGVGYWIAARDHRTHWPIVLVGMLGKVFGPLGFAWSLASGELPLAFGATILTNDLVWWVPFSILLWDAARAHGAERSPRVDLEAALHGALDQHGTSLAALSRSSPVLLVLTRHAGCTFCKEALAELGRQRASIERRGYTIAIVSMSDADTVLAQTRRYGLPEAHVFSDPGRVLYQALDLERGSFMQLLGPVVWWKGFLSTLRGYWPGSLDGDGFQMPGAFVIRDARIERAFRHRRASDRVDYDDFACEIPA